MSEWRTGKPTTTGRYIVTVANDYKYKPGTVRQAELLEYPPGNFYWYVLPNDKYNRCTISAWMEEPEPYHE